MTKARARERAKAKAAEKAAKRRAAAASEDEPKAHAGRFDPGSSTIKSPGARAGGPASGTHRRGAARSR